MRSVVLKPTIRCEQCQLPPRWCICAATQTIDCPLGIDLLLHQRELGRPSSTGKLIARLFPRAQTHVWQTNTPFDPASLDDPDRDIWILHPFGSAMPEMADPSQTKVVLLDGLWNETAGMTRTLAGKGRLVRLPLLGESRYWLRSQQQDAGRFSTAEALLFLLETFHLNAAASTLREQFELHVYANLRARGRVDLAAKYLEESPLLQALPQFMASLQQRRPLQG
jgi:DTW domain-containing protein